MLASIPAVLYFSFTICTKNTLGKSTLHIVLAFTVFSLLHSQHAQTLKGLNPAKSISQYSQEVWTTDNGLPQNSVNAITQTQDGYLWIGTQEGLVRFDGVRFSVFDKNNTPELHNNYISALYADTASGKLWIGTYDGSVIIYERGGFVTLDSIKNIVNSQIHSFFLDRDSSMWIGTRNNGAVKISSSSVTALSNGNGLAGNDVWNIFRDTKGRLWFATEAGVSILDGAAVYSFSEKEGVASKQIFSLWEADDSTLWVGTQKGLQKLSYERGRITARELLTTKDGLPGNSILTIKTDGLNNVWLATNKGLGRIFHTKIESFTIADGLTERLVNTVFSDREGNLWIGTDGGGLNVLKDGIFTSYTTKEGLPNNIVWSIYEDKDSFLWFGTNDGIALYDYKTKSVKTLPKKENLSHYVIWSFIQDSTGALWVGTINGLNKIVNQEIVPPPSFLQPLKEHSISSFVIDRKGALWIGSSDNGLYKVEEKKISLFNTRNGFPSNYINCLAEDMEGNILIGTDGQGLIVMKNDLVRNNFTVADGLGANFIHSIYVDSLGTTWIGTFGGGLSIWKDSSITTINSKNGLFDDVIYQILEDNFHRLWMSCNKGVFQIEKNELIDFAEGRIRSVNSHSYGKENGMASTECNGGTSPAGWRTHDGHLWFPTANGVTTVNPKNISVNTQPPLVVLEDFVIDDQNFSPSDAQVIPPGKQRFEFRYTGLSFDGPRKIQFKVYLEGYDQEWYDVGTRRAAYYSHLPPGEYTFHVIAANADGIWNTAGASFPFVVQAQFYQTSLFLFFVVVTVLLLFYGIFRWRTRQIVQREQALSHLVELRTKDLNNAKKEAENLLHEAEQHREIAEKANTMKTQLLYVAAHDMKSPLMSIEGLAKEISLTPRLDDHSFELSKMIQLNASRMVSLISDLLNLSAIESGKIQLEFETLNASEITALVVSGYEIQAQRKEQKIIFRANPKKEYLISADSTRIQEALENLVSNAIKYSPVGASISISVEEYDGKIRIAVHDEGPGFSDSDKEKIFKRFQKLSAQPTGGEISTGLGLAIVKEIIEAHKGTITLESEPEKGSTFFIDLPAVKSS